MVRIHLPFNLLSRSARSMWSCFVKPCLGPGDPGVEVGDGVRGGGVGLVWGGHEGVEGGL